MNSPIISQNPPPGTCRVNPSTGAAVCTPTDNSPDGISRLIRDQISGNVDRYVEHTSGLNWRIASYDTALDEVQLQAAVEEFVAAQGEGWSNDLEDYQSQVASDGELLLRRLGSDSARGQDRAAREEILEMILDDGDPQARIAILTALSQPGAVGAATLDAAIEFFAGVDLAARSPELAQALGQARLQHVGEQVQAVDPADPATVEAARAAVEDLRDSGYARMLGIDGPRFEETLDALLDTIPVEGMSVEEVNEALENFADKADALDAAAGGEPVATGLRLLAMQSGAIGLETSEGGFLPSDPIDAVEQLASAVRIGNGATQFLVRQGLIAGDSTVATTLGSPALKAVLGRIGIGLGAVQLIRDVRDGDYAQAGFTSVGIAGLALATFGTASWAGPVGIALGVIAFGGSLGLNQWRNVQASNQYMDDASAAFLVHAGFSPDVAAALSDQSGKGISPVPFLFAYGDSLGLDREQTVAWLNSLDPGDLDSIRDRAHYALDRVDGDLSRLTGAGDREVLEYLSGYEEARREGYGHDHGNMFTIGMESRHVVANNWEEFTAILEAKGLVPPAPPLQGPTATPIDLPNSAEILLAEFDRVADGDGYITVDHLRRIRDDASAGLELRMAAEFVLGSKAARSYLDVGQGKGSVDGNISRGDLERAVEKLADGDYLDDLLDTASGRGGRDGNISDDDIANALVDPVFTSAQRAVVEEMQRG